MNRDDVLKKAKKENNYVDEREYRIFIGSYLLIQVSFFIIMAFFTILEFLYFEKSFITSSLFITYCFCMAVSYWYSAIRIKTKKLYYAVAIITTIAFIILTILFVINVHHTFEIKGGYI